MSNRAPSPLEPTLAELARLSAGNHGARSSQESTLASRGGRSRLPTLLGALLLCVLFAAAGMPRSDGALSGAANVELGERAVRESNLHVSANRGVLGAPLATKTNAAVVALPRVVPRTRSIDAGGLPPPRAPTAS